MMDGAKEDTKFIPITSDHEENHSVPVFKKVQNSKTHKLGTFVVIGFLLAWMTWITITTQASEEKRQHQVFQPASQPGNNSVAVFEDERDKRSLAATFTAIISLGAKVTGWAKMGCDISLLMRKAVANNEEMCSTIANYGDTLGNQIGVDGVGDFACSWAKMHREIKEDEEKIAELQKDLPQLKQKITTIKRKMTRAFEVMTYSTMSLNSAVGNIQSIVETIEHFEIMLTENPAMKIVLRNTPLSLKSSEPVSLLDKICEYTGLAATIGGMFYGVADTGYQIFTGRTILSKFYTMIAETKIVVTHLEKVGLEAKNAVDAMVLIENSVRLGKCVYDQIHVGASVKERRDKSRVLKNKLLQERHQLEQVLLNAEEATWTMQNETKRMVKHTNHFLSSLNITCRTNLGTLHSDLVEINANWERVKQGVTLKTAAAIQKKALEEAESGKVLVGEKVEETASTAGTATTDILLDTINNMEDTNPLKEILRRQLHQVTEKLKQEAEKLKQEAEEEAERLKRVELDAALTTLTSMYAKLRPIKIIEAMEEAGIEFPGWTDWIDHEVSSDCDCSASPQTGCIRKKKRTCTTGSCVGPASVEEDRCEGQLTFFERCQKNVEVFAGECKNIQHKTVLEGARHKLLTSAADHGICYRKCKKEPGAFGCQLHIQSCLTGRCQGDCYALTEKVWREDDNAPKTLQETCYIFNSTVEGLATESILKRVLDGIAKGFGEGEFNVQTFTVWMLAMERTDRTLIESQEHGWTKMIQYESSKSDQWGGNPSSYSERNLMVLDNMIDVPRTSLRIYERCNFASNFAYYNLMIQVRQLVFMPKESIKALVQATAALTLSSSFFHGSHTHLGQIMDNLMIKIIAFILYETYIKALGLPPSTSKLVLQLKAAGRPMSGIELAQDITDMFRNSPSDSWLEHVQSLDVPNYESTFGAFILTMDAHAKNGALGNWRNGIMLSFLPVEVEDKAFLNEFDREIRNVLANRVTYLVEEPDSVNMMTTGLKLMLAFIFQENISVLNSLQPFINVIGLSNLNDYLNSINTLPVLSSTLPLTAASKPGVSYPGEDKCSSAHAKWHTQSAQGLLDLFKLVDELVKKQSERKDKLSLSAMQSTTPTP